MLNDPKAVPASQWISRAITFICNIMNLLIADCMLEAKVYSSWLYTFSIEFTNRNPYNFGYDGGVFLLAKWVSVDPNRLNGNKIRPGCATAQE